MKNKIIAILAIILAALTGNQVANLGGSPGNLASDVATSSTVSTGDKSVNVLFATSTQGGLCASRTISTQANAILIQFSPGVGEGPHGTTSLQNGFGHPQAASSTVNYDSAVYGCGAWIVMSSGVGTTTLTITENK